MVSKYKNGNASISIDNDGSRVIKYEDTLLLDYPLNIDIRVSTKCSFGQAPDGTAGVCSFCHESAKTNGKECDYLYLREKLYDLPEGIELAIGANNLTDNLYEFLFWAKCQGYICNLTINQGHVRRDIQLLRLAIKNNIIKGLGVSYRGTIPFDIPQDILDYNNTVFHVICGIDTFSEVQLLSSKGVKKILILGEKDFGFNIGNVNLSSRKHKEWFWWVHKLYNQFDVVSFDNLALSQLNIKRFFLDVNWEIFNQGEHSFYIDSVNGFYHPSSRNNEKIDWNNISIKDYFSTLKINIKI